MHECVSYCYTLIDWELDVKTENLDPLFGRAQTLMRGLSRSLFSTVMQIRTQLGAASGGNAIKVVSEPTRDEMKPLNDEIDRITRLITPPQV